MPEQKRSEELQEILGRMPSWPVRWGSLTALALLIALLCYAWRVSSPEFLRGKAVLISKEAPVRFGPERSGRIGKLWQRTGNEVEPGERVLFLGEYERSEQVDSLLMEVRKRKEALQKEAGVPSLISGELHIDELHEPLERLRRTRLKYQRTCKQVRVQRRSSSLEKRVHFARYRLETQQERKKLLKDEVKQAKETYRRKRKLLEQGAATKKELQTAKERLLQKKRNKKGAERRCLLARSQLNERREEMERRRRERKERKRKAREDLLLALNSLERDAEAWMSRNTLRAPAGGSFKELRFLREGERIEKGEEPFVIIPEPDRYRARAFLPEKGFGKVETGMEVQLELPEYPREEYGVLEGVVESSTRFPVDEEYRVDIRLENGLRTNLGRKLDIEGRASARAALKTREENLLERIFAP